MTDYRVDLEERTPQPTAVIRATVPVTGIPDFLGGAFEETIRVITGQGLMPAGPPFACYRRTEDGFEVEAGFPASGEVRAEGRVLAGTLPGGPTATTEHRGAYDAVGAAYDALGEWVAAHGWTPAGLPWESYLDGPEVPEPRTVVSFPCRRMQPAATGAPAPAQGPGGGSRRA